MKRLLLFLVLAAGGLGAVWLSSGGNLFGTDPVPRDPRPTSPPPAPVPASTGAPLKTGDLPRGKSTPGAEIAPTGRVRVQASPEARMWDNALTGERLEFPAFVGWDFQADSTEGVKDAASGDSGVVARGVRLRVYRDPKDLAEDVARSLHGDREGRPGPVHLEITSDSARADFLHLGIEGTERIEGVKTLVRLEGHVVIKDFAGDQVIRTEQAMVDVDHDFVSGDVPLVALSPIAGDVPDWRLTGTGFRMQGGGSRTSRVAQMSVLTIKEQVDLDVRRLAAASSGAPASPLEPGGDPFRPTRVRSHGPAVLTRSSAADGAYRVVLSQDVHVDQDEGARLAAERVTLDFERAAGGGGPAGPASPAGPHGSFRLRTLLAEEGVRVSNPSSQGAGGLEITAPKMTAVFAPLGGVGTTTFLGHVELSYEGDVATIGRAARDGTVTAVCEDEMVYGPVPPGWPRSGGALRLLGRAHVESRSGDERPQTIDGDEVLLLLPQQHAGTASTAGAPAAGAEKARRRIVGFEARGAVRLDGPEITGAADRFVGRDLDLPTFLVTAEGRGARLAVAAAERAPKERTAGAAPAGPKTAKAARREWSPETFTARGKVVAHVRTRTATGEQALALDGEALDYARATGGRLWSAGGRMARMVMPGDASRDGTIRAPSISFAFKGDERSLWTDGDTQAVVWLGGSPSTGSGPSGARGPRGLARFGARSEKLIEIQGLAASADAPAMSVRVHEGGVLERFEGDAVVDRIEATEIAATLVERVPGPEDASFFGGRREGEGKVAPPSAAGAAPAAAAAGKAAEPVRWTLTSRTRLALAFSDAAAAGGLGGLRSLQATGDVDARSDTMRLEGEKLSLDGTTSEVTLVAAPGKRTRVSSGREADGKFQRIVSPEGTFTLDNEKKGAIKTARFKAPVAGTMRELDAKTGKESRVLLVSATGDLVVVDGRATIDAGSGKVTATMTRKDAGEKEFQPPITVTTPHLELYPATAPPLGTVAAPAKGAKAAQPPPFDRLVAEGPGTRLEIAGAAGAAPTRAIGRLITYDGKASRVHISAEAGKRVYLVRGGLQASFVTLTYDPATDSWDGVGTDAEIEDTTPEAPAK